LGAVLTKDQWWFVLLTAAFQPLVTVTAIALGARWALGRDQTNRRRARSEELAVSAAETMETIWSKLEAVRWNALAVPDLEERSTNIARSFDTAQDASRQAHELTRSTLYLEDTRLRNAVEALQQRMSMLTLLVAGVSSRPAKSEVLHQYCVDLQAHARAIRQALGAHVRGESFDVPADPGTRTSTPRPRPFTPPSAAAPSAPARWCRPTRHPRGSQRRRRRTRPPPGSGRRWPAAGRRCRPCRPWYPREVRVLGAGGISPPHRPTGVQQLHERHLRGRRHMQTIGCTPPLGVAHLAHCARTLDGSILG